MASATKRTSLKRKRAKANSGKKRKASLRTKGSTKSKKTLFGD